MYERNAIVLERYFNEIFNFNDNNNLKQNYYNYCELFECYRALCDAKEKEEFSKKEFENASKEILNIQKKQESLYNDGAKFEYSRYVIFNNIEETPENIKKYLDKINEQIQKNSSELRELGEEFVNAIIDYNEKNRIFEEAIERRENAQKEYDKIYLKTESCYDEILDNVVENAKQFISSENKDMKKELQDILENNGKNEKNPFDVDVIMNTINRSFDIYKVEMDVYLTGYDKTVRLFEEIVSDSVKIDKHLKYYKDSKAKMSFISSEKDYIIQFLDNERIGAIYDKKSHRKLMLEACKKFVLDFEQIDKLYEIINKEIAGRSTKKIYKENYNRLYLIELENSSIEPTLDTGRMRQDAIAFMNLNYWRIEGMRSVYNTFEEIITKIFEKDLTEFIPEELKVSDNSEDLNLIENNVEETTEFVEHSINEESKQIPKKRKVYYSSKTQLANAIYYSLQMNEFREKKNQELGIQDNQYIDDNEKYNINEILNKLTKGNKIDEEKIFSKIKSNDKLDETKYTDKDFNYFKENEDIDDFEALIKMAQDEIIEKENNTIEAKEKNIIKDIDDSLSVDSEDEGSFDLSKLDEIGLDDVELDDVEYEDDVIDNEDVEVSEYDDDESILEIYFNEGNHNKFKQKDNKSKIENINKKVGLIHKLVGFNAKNKKEA